MVLWKILGLMRRNRRLDNEKLRDLYCSPNVSRMIKIRLMR
jgi:hypothetical protein